MRGDMVWRERERGKEGDVDVEKRRGKMNGMWM